jgi:hypothetical protein
LMLNPWLVTIAWSLGLLLLLLMLLPRRGY